MRRKAAVAIERLLRSFPSEPADAIAIRARVQQYVNECGCATGGIFLIVAGIASPAVLVATRSWHPPSVLWSLFCIAAASIAGKLTGILVALLRLRLLRRRLHRRVLALGVTDVHVH
jgi:hypothetical protein